MAPAATTELRPLPAFQRSLSDEHQAVLARWAAGDFRAGDEHLSAAESELLLDDEEDVDEAGRRPCPHPHQFYVRYQTKQADTGRVDRNSAADMVL